MNSTEFIIAYRTNRSRSTLLPFKLQATLPDAPLRAALAWLAALLITVDWLVGAIRAAMDNAMFIAAVLVIFTYYLTVLYVAQKQRS